MVFDVENIRRDFPLLEQSVYGKPLVYLDSGATAQKPLRVIEREAGLYKTLNANIHRGVHHLSQVCTTAMENARETVRRFIGAKHSHVFFNDPATTEIYSHAHTLSLHDGLPIRRKQFIK